MSGQDNPITIKGVLVGNVGSGKTALRSRLKYNSFSSHLQSSVGVDFASVTHSDIKLQLWDIAGKEKNNYMLSIFLRESKACFLCVDLNSENPEEEIESWLQNLNSSAPSGMPVYVIGTKSDLITDPYVLEKKNNELTAICNGIKQTKNVTSVAYLGSCSAKEDSFASESGVINIYKGMSDKMVEIARDTLEITPETKKEKDQNPDNPGQHLLSAKSKSNNSSSFFARRFSVKSRMRRAKMRIGLSMMVTFGIFPLPLLLAAAASYSVERRIDNRIQGRSNNPKKGYQSLE